MKNYMKCHKYSAIVMAISAIVCIRSGIKEKMDVHKCSACVMALSGIICMATGFKMTGGFKKKKADVEKKAAEERG